jgi:hypothetical protein
MKLLCFCVFVVAVFSFLAPTTKAEAGLEADAEAAAKEATGVKVVEVVQNDQGIKKKCKLIFLFF